MRKRRLRLSTVSPAYFIANEAYWKTSLTTVDDGDGKHVLPVTVRLPLVAISPSQGSIPTSASASRQTQSQARTETQTQGTQHFISAKERKAARKAAVLEQAHAESQAQARVQAKASSKGKEKEYVRDDVRVGDTVRIRGRIDEYRRGVEWVRVVVVEVGSGGSVGMSPFCKLHFSYFLFPSCLTSPCSPSEVQPWE